MQDKDSFNFNKISKNMIHLVSSENNILHITVRSAEIMGSTYTSGCVGALVAVW